PDNGSYTVYGRIFDRDGGSTDYATTLVVNNAAPSAVQVSAPAINENGTATLTGSFTDPGTLDSHTVVIGWGDGSASTTLSLGAGVLTFNVTHQYLDNPAGQPHGTFPATVVVKDKDGATGTGNTAVVVNNVAPVVGALNAPAVDENGTTT